MVKVLEYDWDDDDMDVVGNQNCCYDVVMMLVKEMKFSDGTVAVPVLDF